MRSQTLLVIFAMIMAMHPCVYGQELYVYADPASNVPAKSLSLKYGSKWMLDDNEGNKVLQSRHMAEASIGLNKNWMLRPSFTFSDMFTNRIMKWESASIYAKYRFYSSDAVHRHFRAAAYVKGVLSSNNLQFEELNADGDQSVVQGGVILTQLVNKLAISSTFSLTEVIDGERWLKYPGPQNFGFSSFNYSISAGYLLFPKKYTSYKQTNFNLYLELLGSRGTDRNFYFIDLAPAAQLIVNSNTKINLGYRFQLKGNAFRMASAAPSLSLSFERTFFNTFRK
jgi:hypothetical protein